VTFFGPSEHRFRENTRVPVKAPVRLQFDALNELQEAHTANLSSGGMFVQTRNPRPVGTLLRFELGIDPDEPIRGLAEVVWIRAHSLGDQATAGMGIQFGQLDEPSQERLNRVVLQAFSELERNGPSELASQPKVEERAPARRPRPLVPAPVPRTDDGSSTTRTAARPGKAARSRALPSSAADRAVPSALAISGRAKILLLILGLLIALLLLLT
jgi:molecular chaperone DnaK